MPRNLRDKLGCYFICQGDYVFMVLCVCVCVSVYVQNTSKSYEQILMIFSRKNAYVLGTN